MQMTLNLSQKQSKKTIFVTYLKKSSRNFFFFLSSYSYYSITVFFFLKKKNISITSSSLLKHVFPNKEVFYIKIKIDDLKTINYYTIMLLSHRVA